MAKWVKWNIRVEHEVIFLRLSLLWGSSEDVLYLDNYAMLLCFFEYWCICVFHSIFFETFASEIVYFIHQIVVLQSIWHSLSLRNNLLVLARRITAIVLLAKPFGSEKLNKRDFILLSSCFWHPCISHNICHTTETYSLQTFSVTAAVVAPAVVICLNSLLVM